MDSHSVKITVINPITTSEWDVLIPKENFNRFWLALDELIQEYRRDE